MSRETHNVLPFVTLLLRLSDINLPEKFTRDLFLSYERFSFNKCNVCIFGVYNITIHGGTKIHYVNRFSVFSLFQLIP